MKDIVEQNLTLALLFAKLKDHGASHIRVDFYGGGDSGACESAVAIPKGIIKDGEEQDFESGDTPDYEGMPALQPYMHELSDLVTPHLHEYDWWNNDGGHGNIVLNIEDFAFNVCYSICGEDKAEYTVDKDGEIDWESAEPEHEYDDYSSCGTIKIK